MYRTIIRGIWIMDGATTLQEAAELLRDFAIELDKMAADGVRLEADIKDDCGFLITDDQAIAEKYEMEEFED